MENILTDSKIIDRILNKGVEQVLPSKDALRELLLSGKRINIYQGFDPTAPTLHIGHTVGMRKLEDFRKLGHQVNFLIGDFTARIGDPSDKEAARKKLSKEDVENNLKIYVEQASKVIDIFNKENPVRILYNSQWLEPLNFADIIELASQFTVQQMLKRSMFQKRLQEDRPIYLNEFLYPLMQGYDSVMMDIDVEVGGNDQLFNMLAGRDLVMSKLNKEKIVIAGKLLSTADGKKMGKSEGNMITLADSANDMFGKVMAFPDEHIVIGFEILTNKELSEVEEIQKRLSAGENPIELKKELAFEITRELKGEEEAVEAQKFFESVFQKRDMNVEIPEATVDTENIPIVDLLLTLGFAESKSQARRLIEQGAVKVDDERITDWEKVISFTSQASKTIKCGKQLHKITYIS